MECFIDGKSTCERTFWNRLNVLANFQQKEMIMDGLKVFFFDSCITQKISIFTLNKVKIDAFNINKMLYGISSFCCGNTFGLSV